ncbi:MAG: T9SS type A sorting domain-containing protein [Lewinellaceae bacterium]|nr:T9SS type A sorting domain-containing protein [Saprospiraceae bacterium]MCB9356932.1 T9SS type A sorting domain-containing protein [Lewinellaceae bacterium]
MLRVYSLFALVSGFICLTAFRAEDPKCDDRLFSNHTAAAADADAGFEYALTGSPEADTSTVLNILMLNYSAYDSTYAAKVRQLIESRLRASSISEFWQGSLYELKLALATHDAVVVTYPFGNESETVKTYGKLLAEFVRQGGLVVFTGTDDFRMLQQYGLFNVEFGYFCSEPVVHAMVSEHPILQGTASRFPLSDFVYPIEVSDPDFVTLVDVLGYREDDSPVSCWTDNREEADPAALHNYPVVGYKSMGAGKVVYLGMEYYFEQTETARMLVNALRWAVQLRAKSADLAANTALLQRAPRRSEEVLHAGSGAQREDLFDLKIYPNPYYDKATLDIELKNAATVEVDMTDESGRIAALVLPQKSLTSGFYRLELPNLSPGVYFLRCKTGDKTSVRKVVKTASQ